MQQHFNHFCYSDKRKNITTEHRMQRLEDGGWKLVRKTILNSDTNKRGTSPQPFLTHLCVRIRNRLRCVPDSSLDNDKPSGNSIDKGNRLKGQVEMQRQTKSVIQRDEVPKNLSGHSSLFILHLYGVYHELDSGSFRAQPLFRIV